VHAAWQGETGSSGHGVLDLVLVTAYDNQKRLQMGLGQNTRRARARASDAQHQQKVE
jgi:hypothetical protein